VADISQLVDCIRGFNRFYTQKVGALDEGLLQSPFSLAEARVLYELAHRHQPTATELARDLGLDAGYLSRILRGFARRGMIARRSSKDDLRQALLSLTARGKKAFTGLDRRSRAEIKALLSGLTVQDQGRLVKAMRAIQQTLGPRDERGPPYILRTHQPGDMGWVVYRHGTLYAQEYQWDERFEALVARIVASFIDRYDPKRERCWLAERNQEIVGCVFLVKQSPTVARLRLLLVEPAARGLGIGSRLVAECTRFARLAGYRKITLWTNSVLTAARRLYQAAGYRIVHRERHNSFGHNLVGETWELKLHGSSP
jgi:DNA-binding MarR family transcriptional regulator/GNAT superfamily N-acetyltransferase